MDAIDFLASLATYHKRLTDSIFIIQTLKPTILTVIESLTYLWYNIIQKHMNLGPLPSQFNIVNKTKSNPVLKRKPQAIYFQFLATSPTNVLLKQLARTP